MLTVLEESKYLTGRQMLLYSAGLLVVSLLPTAIGLAGRFYVVGAFLAGVVFLGINAMMARAATNRNAKWALWASIIYLPVLLLLMMADKITI